MLPTQEPGPEVLKQQRSHDNQPYQHSQAQQAVLDGGSRMHVAGHERLGNMEICYIAKILNMIQINGFELHMANTHN